MAKPRIIIADTDTSYIIPLQFKFITEFFDKIDLEIITSEEYFDELFASPQKADILIVSEDLYDSYLQRHNISNIFVMMEQYDEEQTSELNVNLIFKYSSIKEIFNEIVGKSNGVFDVNANEKKEPQIIMVYSAQGGVGKTTLALGISACLTKNYKRVLYINASRLQSFQRMLDNQSPISSLDVYSKLSNPTGNIYSEIKHVIRKEMFNYLPPFKASLMSVGLNYSIYEQIALSAKKSNDYDFIVVDADSTFDEEKANLLNVADKVIVVTNQTASSVFSTNLLVSNINGMNEEKYIFICNDFDKEKDNSLISPNMAMKFRITEYVKHITHFDKLSRDDLLNESDVQKITYLII